MKSLVLAAVAAVLPFVPRAGRRPPPPPDVLDLVADEVSESAAAAVPEQPGAPGSLWRDAAGNLRRVPREPGLRRLVNPHEAALRFAGWMRDHGFVGWHCCDDVVDLYRWFSAEEGLEEMRADLLFERFDAVPGVVRDRRRLAGATDPEMQRLRRRVGNRGTLYRVASAEEMAAEDAAAEAVASAAAVAKPAGAAARGRSCQAKSKGKRKGAKVASADQASGRIAA